MGKVRVYEIARELGLDNKELVTKIKAMGILVNNHMSALESEDVTRIKRQFNREKQVSTEDQWIGESLFVRKAAKKPAETTVVEPAPQPPPAPPVVVAPPAALPPVVTALPKPAPPPDKPKPEPAPVEPPPAPPVVVKAAPVVLPKLKEPTPTAKPQQPQQPVAEQVAPPPAPKPAEKDLVLPTLSPVTPPPPKKTEPPKPVVVETPAPKAPAMPAGPVITLQPPKDPPAAVQPAPPAPAPAPTVIPNVVSLGSVIQLAPPAPAPARKAMVEVLPGASTQKTAVDAARPQPYNDENRQQNNKQKFDKRQGNKPNQPAQPQQDFRAQKPGPNRGAPMPQPTYEPGRPQFQQPGKNNRRPNPHDKRGSVSSTPAKPSAPITAPMSAAKKVIRISDTIVVSELAKAIGVKAIDIIKKLISMGMMVTLTQSIDYETAAIVAAEFGWEVQNTALNVSDILSHEEERAEDIVTRPPVVTIMGHVDHGKTTLLDALRKTNVAGGEAGGITQHIGAYKVKTERGVVVFLDTPGHEAFTQMRARGAEVTDVVVLVVAADDGVKPQTIEAIRHAQAAKVPIIVAINKIDKPGADPSRVKTELMNYNIISEEFGGDSIMVPVSAKQGKNLDLLLENILIQSEVLDLKANPSLRASGVVIEARLDKGRGPIATVIVKQGTLRAGDAIVSGEVHGRIRNLNDDRGKPVEAAGPAIPVEVVGLSGVPKAGDTFNVAEDEATAKQAAAHVERQNRQRDLVRKKKDFVIPVAGEEQAKVYPVVIKGDVQGSVEAVKKSLEDLSTDKVKVNVVLAGVGGITETDVNLAITAKAVIIGFNVRTAGKSSQLAEQEGIEIRYYNIIYEAVEETKKAMTGVLEPKFIEKMIGRAEVREIFHIRKVGTIAGCRVTDGKMLRSTPIRLIRDSVEILVGRISSMRHKENDIREIAQGNECGIGIENFNDVKVGDVIECFEKEQVAATL
jgi:translation initiation factor IF-2